MEANSIDQSGSSPEGKKPPPDWSDHEARWLNYEDFMVEVSKRRSPPGPPKAWWLKILETGGGAALITVLIGGLIGQLISLSIQTKLGEREHKQSLLKAEHDQKLVAYNKFLDQRSETVKHTYELIGKCISAVEDLVDITDPRFTNSQDQKDNFLKTYNDVRAQWRNEQLQLGLLMKYYHHNDESIGPAWQAVQDATTAYMVCEYKLSETTGNARQSCEDQKKAIMNALDVLTIRRLEAASKYESKISQ